IVIEPGDGIWIADWATSFRTQFGHDPDYELRGSDPDVPNLEGTWPGFSNDGDEVLLFSEAGILQDALVYEGGDTNQAGWSGAALEPYIVHNVFAANGQILYRMFGADAQSRMPDTDSAMDWAQSTHDAVNGRRVRYPGWDIEEFHPTRWYTESAEVVIGIAPDNAFELLRTELASATSEIRIASHTFRSYALEQELVSAIGRGVSVTVLLEGDPVGGIEVSQRNICQHLEAIGGRCWFMINDENQDIHDRYRYLHAKFIIIDDRLAIVSTENLSPDSFPDDDKTDGTWGRRGVVVVTDAPSVVQHLLSLWNHDFDPLNHRDLAPWSEMQLTFEPVSSIKADIGATNELTYAVRFSEPTRLEGEFAFAVVQRWIADREFFQKRTGIFDIFIQIDGQHFKTLA
ncbi:MAG: phospholipase D-like domain-containing protein, partial [Saprospiraceae bacterium]|nr:phospholipase D-like domain-containing protein [Saprospiraceae bacterium]